MAVPKNKNNRNKQKYFILKNKLKNKILSTLNFHTFKLKFKVVTTTLKQKK